MNARIQYIASPDALVELQSALFSSVNQFSSRDNCHEKFPLNKRLSDMNEADEVECTASRTEYSMYEHVKVFGFGQECGKR